MVFFAGGLCQILVWFGSLLMAVRCFPAPRSVVTHGLILNVDQVRYTPSKNSEGREQEKNHMFFIRISAETFQALLSDYRYLENEIHYYYGENFLKIIYIFLFEN